MSEIYCVEDDESIRELILYALKSGGYEANGFEDGTDFLRAMEQHVPQLVLLDIMLPNDDGLSILKNLKASSKYRDIPVIMLTAKSSEYDKVRGLDLGADDYIIKPFGVMELLSRINAVMRRYKVDDKAAIIIANISINYDRREVLINDSDCALTFKEFELLYYLMKNRDIVLSREKIIEVVWGFDFEGESRTIDMHIKTLRHKLAEGGAADIIKTIRGVGYKV